MPGKTHRRGLFRVALRKESVDRNNLSDIDDKFGGVALRKESVDRNKIRIAPIDSIIDVALRKESVDRNKGTFINCNSNFSRSPQGERG